jgi:dGTPase
MTAPRLELTTPHPDVILPPRASDRQEAALIYTRKQLEEREAVTLAPYGLKSRDSLGRAFQPDPEPEDRTAFQRDRDRILHTTAFRRLEYKTQVFVNYEGDYYRTRLTHTLEVAQIGRTIARSLGANEDLIEAICLSHDLGHPPFGHSGETALNALMAGHGGFDHNKQSLRIVTKLEQRYPQWPGLNLTWEVREGIVKHETEYDVSDAKEYDADKRGHLEAQIANAADELAYTAHDLDDGLRSGLIGGAGCASPVILPPGTLAELVCDSRACRRRSVTRTTADSRNAVVRAPTPAGAFGAHHRLSGSGSDAWIA